MGSSSSKENRKVIVQEQTENESEHKDTDNDSQEGLDANKNKNNVSEIPKTTNRRANKETRVINVGDGKNIHLPCGDGNDASDLNVGDISPNAIKAIKQHEQREKDKKEAEKNRQEVEQKGHMKLDKSGLKSMIERIKSHYDEENLELLDLQYAATRIGKVDITSSINNNFVVDFQDCREKKLTLNKYRQEKSRYLHKLSELASNKLRHNNANLADLSDPNRANKISERFSELYDNEWTDVYDDITKKDRNKTVTNRTLAQSLLSVLKYCFQESQKLSENQRKLLYKTLHIPEENTSIHLTLNVLDLRKATAEFSKPGFVKTIRNGANEKFKQDTVLKLLYPLKPPNSYTKYIDLCSELCWYMHIQSPPLDLDFEGKTQLITAFRPYLRSGQILEYVVWPALLLHKNGPLLAKGVAQFKESTDVKDNKTKNKDTEKSSKKTDEHGNKSKW
ncbi:hypothetical protein ACF0H5_010393 [Mactra antiquata]